MWFRYLTNENEWDQRSALVSSSRPNTSRIRIKAGQRGNLYSLLLQESLSSLRDPLPDEPSLLSLSVLSQVPRSVTPLSHSNPSLLNDVAEESERLSEERRGLVGRGRSRRVGGGGERSGVSFEERVGGRGGDASRPSSVEIPNNVVVLEHSVLAGDGLSWEGRSRDAGSESSCC